MCLNTCFQFSNNITRISTHFFTHMYFQKNWKLLFKHTYQTDLCFGNTSSTQNIEILCHFEIVFPKYNFNVKHEISKFTLNLYFHNMILVCKKKIYTELMFSKHIYCKFLNFAICVKFIKMHLPHLDSLAPMLSTSKHEFIFFSEFSRVPLLTPLSPPLSFLSLLRLTKFA